ncbi:MAG TPA: glycoside hydrolase family 38 C-terminal domain-containing protein [Planctomycetota bacterium]|jgi:alpha-mannosidase
MKKLTFHLIGNAHLDPVWLWDWREGMNEGLITCRTILDLMDEFEELTFIRGESAIYQHIEEHDPKTFRRIVKQVEAGRWDVVGGTLIQPDTNLPATEVFARHFACGQNYFLKKFGKIARVAWAADSFGHCAGLPGIMAAAGITGFAFTRPMADVLPLEKPAFWWEGPSGARVLAYRPPVGWYGTNRDEMPKRLDASLEAARKCDLENVGVFYGLGNHGGGPCRQQLREIRKWAAAHPEIKVVHSGLHRLLDVLRAEGKELPTHRGEMNFTLRGCYASVAKFKFAYRKAEAALFRSERTESTIRSALSQPVNSAPAEWDTLLFNSFHDILPGSSIEPAYDDQIASLGGVLHHAQRIELAALNALAQQVDTRVAQPEGDHPSANAVLAWNPHPFPYRGYMEWEANLDYRELPYKGRPDEVPLRVLDASGKALPLQSVPVENLFESPDWFWRKRVVVPVELPPLGWSVFEYGWVEGAAVPATAGRDAGATPPGVIDNGIYQVRAKRGAFGVEIFRKGKNVFGGAGLSAVVVEDKWGSWGGPDAEEAKTLSQVLERWRVVRVETLEHGPHRASLWVRLAGKQSWIELTFQLYRSRDAVDVSARLLWNERHARLKLVMPMQAGSAEFDVPGAPVRRKPCGEVPGGRWVRVFGKTQKLGFASDSLYCFACHNGEFHATVARGSGYALGGGKPMPPWRPAVDCGELKFRFLLNPGNEALPVLAQTLEQPPVSIVVPAKAGRLPRAGSLAALEPAGLQLLAIKKAEDEKGLVLRVQETEGKSGPATLNWLGKKIKMGVVAAHGIATWRLRQRQNGWTVQRSDIVER